MPCHTAGSSGSEVSRGEQNLAGPGGDRGSEAAPSAAGRARSLARALALTGLIALCAALLPAVASAATGGISGKVTDAGTFEAIDGAEACAYESTFETLVKCEKTGVSGEYSITGLADGSYKVKFTASGYATQWYSAETSWAFADEVKVTGSATTPDVDASMKETGQGSIAGRVTSNGQGVGGIQVCAESTEGGSCGETGGNGEYTIPVLDVDTYTVSFSPQYNSCEEEQGEKVRCVLNANVIGQSVRGVHVKANQTESVNVALQAGGQISGTVTNASITHPGLTKVEVCAFEPIKFEEIEYFSRARCAYTNSSGQYTISGLTTGTYKVEFNGYICSIPKKGEEECPQVYVTTYYHEQQTARKGSGVMVTLGANTSGINESLREAFPTTPASTGAPTLTGTPAVGQTLTCSQGTWSHEPTYLTYQWLRNGTVISGQTGSTYKLQAADVSHSITCSVTAGNGAGSASAASNAVTIPVPLAVLVGIKVKGAVASVTLSCPGAAPCSGAMKLVTRVITRKGRSKKVSNITIGLASFSIAVGKRVTLRVRLTGQGVKLLGKSGRRGLAVQIVGSGVKAQAAKLKPAAKGPAKKGKKK